jgi:DNA-binding transcriptional ArsR family regulator
MTVTGPKVRDFTEGRREIGLEIVHGDAFEAVLAVFVYSAWCGDADATAEYEVGEEWFAHIDDSVDPGLLAEARGLGCCAWVWLGLLGAALELPEPRTADALVAAVRASDADSLRLRLLTAVLGHGEADPDLLRRAAAGDRAAFDEAARSSREDLAGLASFIEMEATHARNVVADALATFAAAAHPDRDRVAAVLARDADHKRTLARTMPADRLVELATNGVTFAAQPDVSTVVLVPAVITRPWVTISEHGSVRIFTYPVSDEHLAADPDAPPTWLVDFYKALGDERRLRLLSVLAEGPAALAELTAQLDLAKSTVHHHLRVLRRAGLVRVTVGDEKEYSLRTDAAPEAARILQAYLIPKE